MTCHRHHSFGLGDDRELQKRSMDECKEFLNRVLRTIALVLALILSIPWAIRSPSDLAVEGCLLKERLGKFED